VPPLQNHCIYRRAERGGRREEDRELESEEGGSSRARRGRQLTGVEGLGEEEESMGQERAQSD
jgi:hypothetical protein